MFMGKIIGCGLGSIARAERDGTRAETRFRLSPKRTSPFKPVGVSVQSTPVRHRVPSGSERALLGSKQRQVICDLRSRLICLSSWLQSRLFS